MSYYMHVTKNIRIVATRNRNLLKKGLKRRATPLGCPYNSGSRRGNPMGLPAFFNKMPLRVHTGQIVERLSNLTLAYYTPPHPKQSGNPFPTRGERLSTVFLPFAPCGRRGRGMRGACVVTGDRSLNMNVWGNRIECCTGCRCINVDCPPIGGYKNLSNKSTHHRP